MRQPTTRRAGCGSIRLAAELGVECSLRVVDVRATHGAGAHYRGYRRWTACEEYVVDGPMDRPAPTAAQEVALWIAGALLTLACFGFLPGLTAGVDSLDLGGQQSEALLFGLF